MRKRVTYRPSKSGSVMGGVVGVIFVLIGLFVVIPTFSMAGGFGAIFGVFWTIVAGVIAGTNFYQAFGKGYIGPEIHIEEEGGAEHAQAAAAPGDTQARLDVAPHGVEQHQQAVHLVALLHQGQQGHDVLIFGALAAGGQDLMSFDLPHDGKHMDRPPLGVDQRGAKLQDLLRSRVLLPLLRSLLFLHNGCSSFVPKLPVRMPETEDLIRILSQIAHSTFRRLPFAADTGRRYCVSCSFCRTQYSPAGIFMTDWSWPRSWASSAALTGLPPSLPSPPPPPSGPGFSRSF